MSSFGADTFQYYAPLSIKDIRIQGNRNLISFRTNETHNNPANCQGSDYYTIVSTELRQEMLSVLLSAHATQKKIGIVMDTAQCAAFERPMVLQVRIL